MTNEARRGPPGSSRSLLRWPCSPSGPRSAWSRHPRGRGPAPSRHRHRLRPDDPRPRLLGLDGGAGGGRPARSRPPGGAEHRGRRPARRGLRRAAGLRRHGVLARPEGAPAPTPSWSSSPAPTTATSCGRRSRSTSPTARRRSATPCARRPGTSGASPPARSCWSPTATPPARPTRAWSPASSRSRASTSRSTSSASASTRKARAQLRCVAAKGNGTYYDADDADDIVESLQTATRPCPAPVRARRYAARRAATPPSPTPVEAGLWSDKVGTSAGDAERWFSYTRTIPGSTVRVGMASLGGDPDEWDTVAAGGQHAARRRVRHRQRLQERSSPPSSSGCEVAVGPPQSSDDCAHQRRGADQGVALPRQPGPRTVALQPPGGRGAAGRRGPASCCGRLVRHPLRAAHGDGQAAAGHRAATPSPPHPCSPTAPTAARSCRARRRRSGSRWPTARRSAPGCAPRRRRPRSASRSGSIGPFASLKVFGPMRGEVAMNGDGLRGDRVRGELRLRGARGADPGGPLQQPEQLGGPPAAACPATTTSSTPPTRQRGRVLRDAVPARPAGARGGVRDTRVRRRAGLSPAPTLLWEPRS